MLKRHFAAPASGPGVDDHQRRAGGQHEMPVLKAQQFINQIILHRAVEVMVIAAGNQTSSLHQHILKSVRVIAPALAQHIGDQRVADDAFGERMAVGRFLPLRGQIPVIGDVVVVENHQARQMRQRPGYVAQLSLEGVDTRLFEGIALEPFGRQRWRCRVDQCPRDRRPHQQIHRHDFGKRHQMIVGAAAGENRLTRAAEKSLTQSLVAL